MRQVALLFILGLLGCKSLLVPNQPFDEATAPPAPDYSDSSAWAALPDRVDDADVVPAGEADRQAEAAVDVFFIHPTTYYSAENWNQPLDDETANEFTDEKVLRNQASAFNEAGRIYAPRYRQATLGAFLTDRVDESRGALDLAYGDVVAAFQYYLEHYNDGRPIIIASHSQGTRHSVRLVGEFFAGEGNALAGRLVAAYTIGFAVPTDHFDRTLSPIKPCETATDTGCLIVYATWLEGGDWKGDAESRGGIPYGDAYESDDGKARHCMNPLTWTTSGEKASSSDHVGAVKFTDDDLSPTPDTNYVQSARCDEALYVELPDSKYARMGKNLHVSDYALFYMDLRKNAVARATAFLEARAVPTE